MTSCLSCYWSNCTFFIVTRSSWSLTLNQTLKGFLWSPWHGHSWSLRVSLTCSLLNDDPLASSVSLTWTWVSLKVSVLVGGVITETCTWWAWSAWRQRQPSTLNIWPAISVPKVTCGEGPAMKSVYQCNQSSPMWATALFFLFFSLKKGKERQNK